ncbi:MAG: class B sortase [Herbinix sp.]|nr:class B sortase [Herbinix sp.]
MSNNKNETHENTIPEEDNNVLDDTCVVIADNEISDVDIIEVSDEDIEVSNEDIEVSDGDIEVFDEELIIDETAIKKKKIKKLIIRGLRILFTIGFFVFLLLFINEVLIQPYKLKKSIEKAKDLYQYEALVQEPDNILDNNEIAKDKNSVSQSNSIDNTTPTPTPDPNRDEMGRLRKFGNLLKVNEDVKGWIRLDNINGENDSKIDYVVVQSDASDPEYYLEKAWDTHDYLKAGSIFLDCSSSVESNSKNLVIHGHNMTSSDDMFHYLLEYNNLDFLKEHPIISFDTIYDEALWKVFSVYITPGNNDRDDFFPFVKSNFASNRDFMEYIYQIRVRSLFYMDDIDINDDDQILTLSTCSYELSNYRTIIVARKVRAGEDSTVNTDNFEKKDANDVLYAPSYYWRYGGKAPTIPTFDVALEDGLIPWYNPMGR